MTVTFSIHFESDDFSECTGTSISGAGSRIETTEAAAMQGSYGCECEVDGVADARAYFYKDFSNNTDDIRLRWFFDPNSFTMADDTSYICMYMRCDGSVGGTWSLVMMTHRRDPISGDQLRIDAKEDDNSGTAGTLFDISDDVVCIEVHIERASSDIAADGRVRTWADGVLKDTISDLDNYDLFHSVTTLRLGFYSYVDVGTDGICYYDAVILNDDGGEIGCVVPGAALPMASDHYRRRRVN